MGSFARAVCARATGRLLRLRIASALGVKKSADGKTTLGTPDWSKLKGSLGQGAKAAEPERRLFVNDDVGLKLERFQDHNRLSLARST